MKEINKPKAIYVTPAECEAHRIVSRQRIFDWIREGKLKNWGHGRTIMIDYDKVLELCGKIKSNRRIGYLKKWNGEV